MNCNSAAVAREASLGFNQDFVRGGGGGGGGEGGELWNILLTPPRKCCSVAEVREASQGFVWGEFSHQNPPPNYV